MKNKILTPIVKTIIIPETKKMPKNVLIKTHDNNFSKQETIPNPNKKDGKAPKFLEIIIKDDNGRIWKTVYATEKTFSTGSVGYFISDKMTNMESSERYQINGTFTLIGSKR